MVYYDNKWGKIIDRAQRKNNLPNTDNSVLYLVLQVFGLAIVNYALMQNDINQITKIKNAQFKA